MVGADPSSNSSAIIPLDFNVAGQSFNGTDVIPAILSSPQFQNGDYSSTTSASENKADTREAVATRLFLFGH